MVSRRHEKLHKEQQDGKAHKPLELVLIVGEHLGFNLRLVHLVDVVIYFLQTYVGVAGADIQSVACRSDFLQHLFVEACDDGVAVLILTVAYLMAILVILRNGGTIGETHTNGIDLYAFLGDEFGRFHGSIVLVVLAIRNDDDGLAMIIV